VVHTSDKSTDENNDHNLKKKKVNSIPKVTGLTSQQKAIGKIV
jgi:hypothetical protein